MNSSLQLSSITEIIIEGGVDLRKGCQNRKHQCHRFGQCVHMSIKLFNVLKKKCKHFIKKEEVKISAP